MLGVLKEYLKNNYLTKPHCKSKTHKQQEQQKTTPFSPASVFKRLHALITNNKQAKNTGQLTGSTEVQYILQILEKWEASS